MDNFGTRVCIRRIMYYINNMQWDNIFFGNISFPQSSAAYFVIRQNVNSRDIPTCVYCVWYDEIKSLVLYFVTVSLNGNYIMIIVSVVLLYFCTRGCYHSTRRTKHTKYIKGLLIPKEVKALESKRIWRVLLLRQLKSRKGGFSSRLEISLTCVRKKDSLETGDHQKVICSKFCYISC